MDYSVLWDPGEAAYVMIYLAKLTLTVEPTKSMMV